jgi:hypothetical protein
MPWAVKREWEQSVRLVDDENRRRGTVSFIAGMYLPNYPAILIREDANRWTLVHEFMHHNFQTLAVKAGYDDGRVQVDLRDLPGQIDQILKSDSLSDSVKIAKAVPLFLRLSDSSDAFIIRHALEEVTVEAMIQDGVDAGEITYVPAKAYANATWYIGHSQGVFIHFYDKLDDLYSSLRGRAQALGNWKENDALAKYFNLKEKRQDQILAMNQSREQTARDRVSSPAAFVEGTDGVADATPADGWMPCAEAGDSLEFLESVEKKIAEAAIHLN